MSATYMTSHISLQRGKINEISDQMPCLGKALFETEMSIKTSVCKYKPKYILYTFGEEIIALNLFLDVFQLDLEKFECCRLLCVTLTDC